MKLFNIDWQDFLWRAVIWGRVSSESQEAFLKLKNNATTDKAQFGDDFALLLEHHFLDVVKEYRCRVHDDCRGFTRAARVMFRQRLFTESPTCDLRCYLDEHFSRDERNGLCPHNIASYHTDAHLKRAVASISWVRSFLAAEDAADWEKNRANKWREPARWFAHADVVATAKKLINHLLADPHPVPFVRLPDLLPDASVDVIGAVVAGTIRYVLLFTGMDEQLEPHIGLWPSVVQRLGRPSVKQPVSVQPDQQFVAAPLLEDLTTLVVAAAGQPLRLRTGDGRLFAKVVKELQPRLLALPAWMPPTITVTDTEARLTSTVQRAEGMDLVNRGHGSRPELHATKSGEQWLAGTPQERLRAILAHSVNYVEWFFATDHSYGAKTNGQPDLPAALSRAFGAMPEEQFVRWDEFLAWQADSGNPYTELFEAGKRVRLRSAWYQYEPTLEEMENQWYRDLMDYAVRVLLPIGGLTVGCFETEESLCLALTEVGRFFVGQRDDFSYAAEHREEGQVVVQPNFEVAFLSPAPLAEAALARFADRKGAGLGALFQLTKTAIFGAAGAGITCDQVLDTLRRVSTKELPKNVVREVEGWFGQCRTVTVKTATLFHCPDPDTAARVVAAGGKKTELLTDTVVAVSDTKAKKTVLQKLNRAGIFAERGHRKRKQDEL